jgi:hypothetical protein
MRRGQDGHEVRHRIVKQLHDSIQLPIDTLGVDPSQNEEAEQDVPRMDLLGWANDGLKSDLGLRKHEPSTSDPARVRTARVDARISLPEP